MELYARAGIPEYWVLDLTHGTLIVFRAPDGTSYADRAEHGPDESIRPLAWPDVDL